MSNYSVKEIAEILDAKSQGVIIGKKHVLDLAVISLLCGGHILIDDVPGTGKTVLAKLFANSLSLDFKRVQCVPDMLPSDLVGVNFFDMKQSEFRFIKGPVFTKKRSSCASGSSKVPFVSTGFCVAMTIKGSERG